MKSATIVLSALVINVILYLIMETMVARDRVRLVNSWETQTIDFVRTPLEDQTKTKDRRRKPPPKPEELKKPQARMNEILAENMELPTPTAALDVTSLLGAGGIALGGRLVDGQRATLQTILESDLIPVSKFPPRYPTRAAGRGLEGFVEVAFIVRRDGTVQNPEVRKSVPAGVFDHSAIEAVSRWRYKPMLINGEAVVVRVIAIVEYELAD